MPKLVLDLVSIIMQQIISAEDFFRHVGPITYVSWWVRSGSVVGCSPSDRGSLVLASSEALCCVIEQGSLYCLNPGKRLHMTEKSIRHICIRVTALYFDHKYLYFGS